MKLLSLALLNLAFVTAIFAQNCSLCPDGGSPLNGDRIIYEEFGDIYTCNDAVDEVKNATDEGCKYIFDKGFAFFCGCPGVEAGPCPGLCLDGSNVTSPDLATVSLGSTCAVLDLRIKAVRNESRCPLNDYRHAEARAVCGCETVYCQACLGSYVPDDFLQVPLSLPDGTVTTCGEFESVVVHLNSTQCSMVQDTIFVQCGCPAQRCTLCPGGEYPSIEFSLARNIPGLEDACFVADLDIHGFEPNCTDQTETGLPYLCGCPNAELPSDAVGCTLCRDGNISDPTLILYNGTYTCDDIDFLISTVNQSICDEVQASEEAFLCGCSGVEAPTTSGPLISVTMVPSIMVAIYNMGGGGMGGGGGMRGMGRGGGIGVGGGDNQGMGMMTMTPGRQLRSGSFMDIFPPRSSRGLAM